MSDIYAVAGAITTATRLAKALEKNSCKSAKVVHTPSSISTGGCSYSVKTDESCLSTLNALQNEGKFKIKKIFKQENINEESVYIDISR